MALYAIADLHLSLNEQTDKPMTVFGDRWKDHAQKINTRWRSLISETDTVVIPGDLSWALRLEEAEKDLLFIHSLPGQKIISKGNHDLWWSTRHKIDLFFAEKGIDSIHLLYNNAYLCDNIIITGTRGWYNESGTPPQPCDYKKITARECGRMRASLKEAKALQEENGDLPIVAFTHFPPVWRDVAFDGLIDVLCEFGIKKCYFGHIHGVYTCPPKLFYRGIEFELISADFLDFTPRRVSLRDIPGAK